MGELQPGPRGMTPVVSETLAIGLAVLYIGGMTTMLLGGVVPAYETRAGAEVAERVLSTAAGEIERAPPVIDGRVETQTSVTLPSTIADSSYSLVLSNGSDRLRLDHPDPEIAQETRLSLPANVSVQNGTVSGESLVITVSGPPADRTLTIAEGDT